METDAAHARARAPALAQAAAAAARRSGAGGRAALAPRPPGEHRRAHAALRCRRGAAGRQAEAETACFRVAQEAITNVLRHAGARNVWLRLFTAGGRLALSVRDDGARVRSGSGAAPRRGRREPGPGGHGRARGARGRRLSSCARRPDRARYCWQHSRWPPAERSTHDDPRGARRRSRARARGHPLAPRRDARSQVVGEAVERRGSARDRRAASSPTWC